MEKKKSIKILEKNQKVDTVIYLLLNYYLYNHIKVSLKSKAKKIIILLKDKTIPKEYQNYFIEKFFVNSIDYSEIKNIVSKIKEREGKKKNLRIVACDEHYFYMVSRIREELKIPGYGISKTLNLINKIKMKDKIRKNKILTHIYKKVQKMKIKENLEEYIKYLEKEINYPMFIKPSQKYGSIGTKKIINKKTLKKTLKK